jgi:hypothetical protein
LHIAERNDRYAGISIGSVIICRRSAHENHAEVIIGDLAGAAQCEVRGDQSARAGELTFAALDPSDYRAMLQRRVRTFA